jgi:hypothetical protein
MFIAKVAFAAADLSGTPPAVPVDTQQLSDEDLKESETLRDPFWPKDYKPMYVKDPVTGKRLTTEQIMQRQSEEEWVASRKLIQVKGVSRVSGPAEHPVFAAFINGKMVLAGGIVPVTMNGKVFNWRVTRITLEDGPVFERANTPPANSHKASIEKTGDGSGTANH